MENVINVAPRAADKKGAARKLRDSGRIPGVLYGHAEKALSFSVDPAELERLFSRSGMGRNTVLKVEGLERSVMALLKDAQVERVKRRLVHVDFLEVRDGERIYVEVPLEIQGKAAGLIDGGSLQFVKRTLGIMATPLTIPKSIPIDVTELQIGDSLHIRDLKLAAGIEPAEDGHLTVLSVLAPIVEEVAAPVEGVPVEGEAVAEGGDKAAPAGADKDKDKAKGKDKKD